MQTDYVVVGTGSAGGIVGSQQGRRRGGLAHRRAGGRPSRGCKGGSKACAAP
jgi:hypothetical protein